MEKGKTGGGSVGSGAIWAAVGALATVAATIIAFLAYVAPRAPDQDSDSSASTAPVTATSEPTATVPEPTVTTSGPTVTTPEPVTTTRQTSRPVTAPTLPPLSPAGCAEALEVVDTYYRTAGSTELSRQAAASQAYQDMMRVGISATGYVRTLALALSHDFQNMQFILAGQTYGDRDAAQAKIDRDAQELRRTCGVD